MREEYERLDRNRGADAGTWSDRTGDGAGTTGYDTAGTGAGGTMGGAARPTGNPAHTPDPGASPYPASARPPFNATPPASATPSTGAAPENGPRGQAKATGRDLLDRAVEKKDELRQRAGALADERRTGVAERASSISYALHGAADTLRDNGEPQLSDWVHQAAGQVERVVGYLEGKRADGMAEDLENLARQNPALFLGGTYAAGLALGRFLRASSPERRMARDERAPEAPPEPADTGAFGAPTPAAEWAEVGEAPGTFGPTEDRGATSPDDLLEPDRGRRVARAAEWDHSGGREV